MSLSKVWLAGLLLVGTGAGAADAVSVNFDKDKADALPEGFKASMTVNKKESKNGEVPGAWKVVADAKAGSAPNVLSLAEIKDATGYNLCWNDKLAFKNGVIEAKVRGDKGAIDQGGGILWRAKDSNNYYVARYNPLEGNFRLYVVKDGDRKQLATTKTKLAVPAGEWFTIKVSHDGDKIEAFLNDEKLLEATDATLPDSGGVGFWTKADAATSFDDLVVTAK
jgi:hypothetical protein